MACRVQPTTPLMRGLIDRTVIPRCAKRTVIPRCGRNTMHKRDLYGDVVGAWSTGPFDNDSAADWAGELTEAPPTERLPLLTMTLQAVLPEGDSRDPDSEAEWGPEEAIAAAAVVAAAMPGGPAVDETYGPTAAVIDTLRVDEQLRALALRAVQEATIEGSEWHYAWSEADALDDALHALQPLINALKQS